MGGPLDTLRRGLSWVVSWWPALLLGLATIGAYGAVYYSFGVLLAPIRDATGWSTSTLAGGFSLSVLAGGAAGVLAGRVLDRFGARPILIVAVGVGCASLLAASYARESWQFIAAWMLGGGAVAGGLYYNITMSVTARLYPARRAAAFSVLTLLGALAGPIFYPLSGWLVATFEWRIALRLLVLALAVCTLPAAIFVQVGRSAPPRPSDDRGDRDSLLSALLDQRVLYTLATIGVVSLGTSALTVHQVPAMQATGISLAAASAIAGTRGFFQFSGRMFLSPLVARLGIVGAVRVLRGQRGGHGASRRRGADCPRLRVHRVDGHHAWPAFAAARPLRDRGVRRDPSWHPDGRAAGGGERLRRGRPVDRRPDL